jgi:hypothetical protein
MLTALECKLSLKILSEKITGFLKTLFHVTVWISENVNIKSSLKCMIFKADVVNM